MEDNKLKDEQFIEQRKQDILFVALYQINQKNGVDSPLVSNYICKRSEEIVQKIKNAVIAAINSPELKIPELEHVWIEPNSNICKDLPSNIFNYTDKLTLLNEGYALYDESDDKKMVEYRLEEIIHSAFEGLSLIEKNILIYSSDFYDYQAGMPWYEWEVLNHLLTGIDYDDTMKKVDNYNEEIYNIQKELYEQAESILEIFKDKCAKIFNSYTIAPLQRLIPNPDCCECNDFPREIFSNTEKLALLKMTYAIYKDDSDEKIVEKYIWEAIDTTKLRTSVKDIDILIKWDEFRSLESISKERYEYEVIDDLYYREDFNEMIKKVTAYAKHELIITRDYHYGIVECHSLLDSLMTDNFIVDKNLVDVFSRLIYQKLYDMENPSAYYAEQQKSKSYRQAIDECCDMIHEIFYLLYKIDKWGDVRRITFGFIEKIYRKVACFLYGITPDEKEEITSNDILQMQLPLSNFDFLRIKNAKQDNYRWKNIPSEYLESYNSKNEYWDTWKYNLPPMSDFD